MMSLNIYGLTKCSTCQKALTWLDDEGVAYKFSDVKDNPLEAKQVAKWSKALGGWEKMINRAGYTWRGLAVSETADLTEAKAVALAVKNPSLIRRPLVEYKDGSVSVGFSEKTRGLLKP
jgi:arsenate reductase (glutaredoxin)